MGRPCGCQPGGRARRPGSRTRLHAPRPDSRTPCHGGQTTEYPLAGCPAPDQGMESEGAGVYLSAVAVFGVGTPLAEMAEIATSVVSWKIVCVSLVPKCRLPEAPQEVGSATAR